MNHGIHLCPLVECLFCFPLHTPDCCTAEANGIIVSELVAFFILCFFSIFSLDATLKCILLAVILSRFGHRPGSYTIIDF